MATQLLPGIHPGASNGAGEGAASSIVRSALAPFEAKLHGLSIAKSTSILVSLNLALLGAVSLLFFMVQAAGTAAETALRARGERLQIVAELGRTSYLTTRLARAYVVTGEESYRRYRDDVLAIRDGKKIRPRVYDRAYWDKVMAGRPVDARGRLIPVEGMTKEAGYTGRELVLFHRARRAGDVLTAIEREAMSRPSGTGIALIYSRRHTAASASVMEALGELNSTVESRSDETVGAVRESAERLTGLLIAALCLAAAVAAFSAWRFVGGVVRPLCRLSAVMDEIAADGAHRPIPYLGRGDEIGRMARALHAFRDAVAERDRLHEAKHLLSKRRDEEAAAHGHAIDAAAARAKRAGQMETLVHDFSGELLQTMAAVIDASVELNECAQTMTLVATGTERRVAEAEESGRDTAAHVDTVAATCRQLARATGEIETQTVRSIASADRAVEAVRRTTATVDELRLHSGSILGIVTLIGRIAGKTNRLAINATIEAAHAGEAGRGFAVVAAEVKSLARQTAAAADEISVQLCAVHDASRETVLMVDDIATSIAESREISRAIGSAVEQQANATGEISANADRAAERTRQSAGSMATIRTSAGHTHQAVTRMMGAASTLTGTSEAVRAFVDRFADDVRRT